MKIDITPVTYEAIRDEYLKASAARRSAIRRQHSHEKMTQQKIAEFWGIDITRVNKIINSRKRMTNIK